MTETSEASNPTVSVQTLKTRALDVATELVAARGPDDVNVRQIAEMMGTGASSLYYYFKSKDALLAEVAVQGFRQLEAAVISSRENGSSPQGGAPHEPIRTCGRAYLQFIRERPMLYKVMYSERILGRFEVVQIAERQAFATFALLFAQGAPTPDSDDAALALWGFGRGVAALTMASESAQVGTGRDLSRRLVHGLEVLLGRRIRRPD